MPKKLTETQAKLRVLATKLKPTNEVGAVNDDLIDRLLVIAGWQGRGGVHPVVHPAFDLESPLPNPLPEIPIDLIKRVLVGPGYPRVVRQVVQDDLAKGISRGEAIGHLVALASLVLNIAEEQAKEAGKAN